MLKKRSNDSKVEVMVEVVRSISCIGELSTWEVKAGDTEAMWKACYCMLEIMEEVAATRARGVSL
jgi:hypothetical protein